MKHKIRQKDFTWNNQLVECENYTRSKAIKAMCTECLGFEDHPSSCTSPLCPLFPFRGKILLAYKEGESNEEV